MSITKVHGARLPHWRTDHASYFVTFRLANSLPQFLAKEIEAAKQEILHRTQTLRRSLTIFEIDELEELHFREMNLQRFDQHVCHLQNPAIAQIVAEAIKHFDGARYHLFAWALMPNHIHVVLQPSSTYDLPSILHTWKKFTAREANKILGHTGQFWQEEYYDHLIRNEDDLLRCMKYTFDNPDKAKMSNWPWKWKMNDDEAVSKAFPELVAS